MYKTGVITANYWLEINDYQRADWEELRRLHRAKFGPENLDAMLARIADMGFGYVELYIGHAGHSAQDPLWKGVTAKDIIAMFDKHGLQLASYCVGGLGLDRDFDAPFEFADALGAPMLSGWLGREPESLSKIASYCERYDKRYAIENHGPTYSLATAEEILAACGHSERIGACPDTGIFARAIGDAVGAAKLLAEHTIHTHLKGFNKAKGAGCAPGDDDIGLDQVVRILRDIGYSGVYSIEYEVGHNPDAELVHARQWLLDTLAS